MTDDLEKQVLRADRETKERIYRSLKAFFSLGGVVSLPLVDNQRKELIVDDEQLYLSTICDVLQSKGLVYSSPALLRRGRGYDSFKQHKEAGIDKFFQREPFTRAQKLVLLKMGINLIVDNLRYHRIPCTAGNVLLNFHKIPALIDRELPGYAERHVLTTIFRNRGKS